MLEVLAPGLLTTVQDEGRPGLGRLGVAAGGAVDRWSLAAANALLGNEPGAAALELTLIGPDLRVAAPLVAAIAGADLGGVVETAEGAVPLPPGQSRALPAGAIIRFPGPVAGETGCRAYLAVPGGIDVPAVLGSRSTALAGAFGGLDGRALATGDRLQPVGAAGGGSVAGWPASSPHPAADAGGVVRVLPGPAPNADAALAGLCERAWAVSPTSDRMGIRLDGPPLAGGAGDVLTQPTAWGAVQLPSDGRPIVLLADHQPTGGYPVIAVAITADHPILGQLGPGAEARFAPVTPAAAREALAGRRRAMAAAIRQLRRDARWDGLAADAGG